MPTLSLGWSSIARAIGRVQWLHSGISKKDAASPTDANTLTTDNEGSPDVQAERKLSAVNKYHSHGSSSIGLSATDSPNYSTGPGGNASTDDEAGSSDDEVSINDVESLKRGVIKTSKNEANAPYTILLVGETGVGKSSVLEFFANVLAGKDVDHCDFEILDRSNEQLGPDNQSQTDSARLYELRSNNGIIVRILDTPGLADTRGLQQDELHKKSIATQIQKHLDSITAVLVLANGTVPRVTVGTDYALSTLSTIFPKTLANNIAFMSTNVLNPLHWNFSKETIPEDLRHAPRFLLNNPIALQRKYIKLRNDSSMKGRRADLRKAAKAAEQETLGMLVKLFDWLDGRDPQSTEGITSLRRISQNIEAAATNIIAQTDFAATIKAEIDEQTQKCRRYSADMKEISAAGWELRRASGLNYPCKASGCHSMCPSSLLMTPFRYLFHLKCRRCKHRHRSHSHTRCQWVNRTEVVEGPKKLLDAARGNKKQTEALITEGERALANLEHTTDGAVEHLAELTEDYIGRSLSGRLSTHAGITIRFLKERDTDMKKTGEGQRKKNQDSLSLMERKLVLLKDAEKKARKGT